MTFFSLLKITSVTYLETLRFFFLFFFKYAGLCDNYIGCGSRKRDGLLIDFVKVSLVILNTLSPRVCMTNIFQKQIRLIKARLLNNYLTIIRVRIIYGRLVRIVV